MPYISSTRRRGFTEDGGVQVSWDNPPTTPGELNFVLSQVIHEYLDRVETPSYRDHNDVIGVLESLKLEYYRRAVAIYEDSKMLENGDIDLFVK